MRIPKWLIACVMTCAFFSRCSGPSLTFADAPKFNLVDEQDAPEMQRITKDEALRIFGDLIDEKLEPYSQADAMLQAKIDAFEERLSSLENPVVAKAPAPPPALPKVTVKTSEPEKHWSYPGHITTHLQSERHGGINTNGMTIEQQLALHDQLHEAERSGVTKTKVVRSPVVQVPAVQYSFATSEIPMVQQSATRTVTGPFVQRSTTTSSSCPGGVCPTRPQTRGLFRWR